MDGKGIPSIKSDFGLDSIGRQIMLQQLGAGLKRASPNMCPVRGDELMTFNPKLDLKFERVLDVPPAAVWDAWTKPELLMQWFCPKPWKVTEAVIDLRPGGKFYTLMQGPEGQQMPNTGCYLEVVPQKRLVWTSALQTDFRPNLADPMGFPFTAAINMEPQGAGTKYAAIVHHANEADQAKHAAMGFEQGWGAALDQMIAMIKAG